jgi:transposase
MLTAEGCVSINRTQQMVSELTNGIIHVSMGTIAKWTCDFASHVAPSIEKIKESLLVSSVLNKDETGVRAGKNLNWFHVLGSKTHTLYSSHKKRGNDADKEMGVLPAYGGVLVHDHLVGLYAFACNHAECNAHALRYLKAAIEGKKRKWAEDMITLLLEAKTALESNGAKPLDGKAFGKISHQYDKILEQGRIEFLQDESPDYNGEDMKLLRRLKEYKTEHLRFASNINVPFDNNQAERDLRMIKAKVKISGCFRAHDGGEVFAAIKSYTSTLRKNRLNIFLGIKLAFAGVPLLS